MFPACGSAMPTTPSSPPASPRSCSTQPAVASVDVRGGGPGTRETDLLDPAQTVEGIDAIVLSGGSAFGLDAASGVQAGCASRAAASASATRVVPIVPGAILFDLLNGGDKDWGRYPPYRELGYAAAKTRGRGVRARQRRRRAWRHHRQPQGRRRLGFGADARRHHGRRAGRGQCRRQRDGRRRPAVLGGAVRAGQANSAAAACRRRCSADELALRSQRRRRGENTTHRRRRDRRHADQGAGQAPRRHGAERFRPRDLSGAYAARRRRRVRRRDRAQAARRSGLCADRARHGGRQCAGARHRPRRLRGDGAALPRRAAELEGQVRSARGNAPPDRAPDRRTAYRPSSFRRACGRWRARASAPNARGRWRATGRANPGARPITGRESGKHGRLPEPGFVIGAARRAETARAPSA